VWRKSLEFMSSLLKWFSVPDFKIGAVSYWLPKQFKASDDMLSLYQCISNLLKRKERSQWLCSDVVEELCLNSDLEELNNWVTEVKTLRKSEEDFDGHGSRRVESWQLDVMGVVDLVDNVLHQSLGEQVTDEETLTHWIIKEFNKKSLNCHLVSRSQLENQVEALKKYCFDSKGNLLLDCLVLTEKDMDPKQSPIDLTGKKVKTIIEAAKEEQELERRVDEIADEINRKRKAEMEGEERPLKRSRGLTDLFAAICVEKGEKGKEKKRKRRYGTADGGSGSGTDTEEEKERKVRKAIGFVGSQIVVKKPGGSWTWTSDKSPGARWYVDLKVYDCAGQVRATDPRELWKKAVFRGRCFLGREDCDMENTVAQNSIVKTLDLMEAMAEDFKHRHPDVEPNVFEFNLF
jgi:hypothetical protein